MTAESTWGQEDGLASPAWGLGSRGGSGSSGTVPAECWPSWHPSGKQHPPPLLPKPTPLVRAQLASAAGVKQGWGGRSGRSPATSSLSQPVEQQQVQSFRVSVWSLSCLPRAGTQDTGDMGAAPPSAPGEKASTEQGRERSQRTRGAASFSRPPPAPHIHTYTHTDLSRCTWERGYDQNSDTHTGDRSSPGQLEARFQKEQACQGLCKPAQRLTVGMV